MSVEGRLESLVEQVLGAQRPVLVEAAEGSGKQELALACARAGGARVSRLGDSDLSEAIVSDEPVVLMESDHHRANDPVFDRVIADGLQLRSSDQPLLITAARLGPRAQRVVARRVVECLNERDLWFGIDALGALAADRGGANDAAALVHQFTDGWPRLVWDVARPGVSWANSERLTQELGDALDRHLGASLAELRPAASATLSVLAVVDVFNRETAERLGDAGVIDEITDAGVPVSQASPGWFRLPDAVRSWLRRNESAPPPVPRKVLDQLNEHGFALAAIEAALRSGQREDAASLVAGLTVDQTMRIDRARFRTALEQLGPLGKSEPRACLVEARVAFDRGDLSTAGPLLDGVLHQSDEGTELDELLREEFLAARALVHYLNGELDTARELLPPSPGEFASPIARARQREVESGISALTLTPEGLTRARAGFRAAEQAWTEAGQTHRAAVARGRAALEIVLPLGQLNEAADLLGEARSVFRSDPIRSAVNGLLQARALALAGRTEEAMDLVAEMHPLVDAVQLEWIRAYELNARLIVASSVGDTDGVRDLEHQIRSTIEQTMENATGALLLADWIDAHVRCGQADDARRCLLQLEQHAAAEQPDVLMARIVVQAHLGDAGRSLALVASFRETGFVVPRGGWRLELAQAVAHQRLGDPDEAASAVAKAEEIAHQLGVTAALTVTERALVSAARGDHTPAPSQAVERTRSRVDVVVLGEFSVTDDGIPVRLHAGRPQRLLKALVLAGGGTTIDAATELLWPDAEPAKSRQRLRNTLSRLRAALGPIFERDGELLRLDKSQVSSDYGDWHHRATKLLNKNPDAPTGGLDFSALINESPNELLPGDRYEDWLQDDRRAYETLLLRLVDRRMALAKSNGELDVLAAMCHRSLDIDPHGTYRIDAVAAELAAAGQREEAVLLERRRSLGGD